MVKFRSSFFVGWAIVLAVLGGTAVGVAGLPSVRNLTEYRSARAVVDTVTYGDKRIVYTVDVDTATNEAGQLRYVLDLATAPSGARMLILMKPNFDSAMVVTGDTFAMTETDSATAEARAIAWSVTDPFTVALAWHQVVPPAITNFTLAMVFDTLKATWTESADDYQVEGGLNSGPGEDYTDTVAASPNLQQVVAFGSYWTCARAIRAGVLSDNRCDNIVYVDTGGTNDTFPNEPAGYILLTERVFSDYEEDGWGNNGISNLLIPFVDATAPISPSNVGRAKFGAGRTGGTAPMNTFLESVPVTSSLYLAFGFKVSANWQQHQSGVSKIHFIGANDYGGGGAPVYTAVQGTAPDGDLSFQVRLQGPGDQSSESAGSNLGPNLSSLKVVRDVWSTIEIIIVANTGTNFDGTLDVWMDGVKTHEYTDIKYFDDTADPSNHKFDVIKWNPTWGGTGDTITELQYQYMDHLRMSGP